MGAAPFLARCELTGWHERFHAFIAFLSAAPEQSEGQVGIDCLSPHTNLTAIPSTARDKLPWPIPCLTLL